MTRPKRHRPEDAAAATAAAASPSVQDPQTRRRPGIRGSHVLSLGEQPHDPAGCHEQGRPHLGPCCDDSAGAGAGDEVS